MKTERRWIAALKAEAEKEFVKMPWARGERRAAWIAKRDAAGKPATRLARA